MNISYESALKIAEEFATEVSNKYGKTIVAVFAVGSLGSDYYRPGQSDIDTVVIVNSTREEALHIENQIRPIADSYQQKYNVPKGFGAIVMCEEQLHPPYIPNEELVLEILRLKVQSKIIFGEYDTDKIPSPPKEAIIEDARSFQFWADSEGGEIKDDVCLVNSTLIALKRYLLIECGIVEFNKFKVVDLYLSKKPPIVFDELFGFVNAKLNGEDVDCHFEELVSQHNKLFEIVNKLTIYMNLKDIYTEEDMFPREIALYEKRDYGVLFYSERNRDSYDSNHAVIYKNSIPNLKAVLYDIVLFYREKGLVPIIYQSISDNGYFEENKRVLEECGFEIWTETQKYMVLREDNVISPNESIQVRKEFVWREDFGREIFEKAGEPWEIDVMKRALNNSNTLFFVAYCNDRPVGMTHCHVTNGVCRVDYLLVAKDCRNMGVGRAIIKSFVEYCRENGITNCYLWPDGETAEKIYYEAGFRVVEIKQAGRAVYKDIKR